MLAEFVLVCTVVLAVGVYYRLRLHPLAKYPGPLLGRITDWYTVYHSIKGDRHTDYVRLHEKYGKIVRYGPNRLSINSATGLRTIYGTQPQMRKSSYYDAMQFYMEFPSTNATTDIAEHHRKRRALAPALSDRMLHIYEPGFLSILRKFLDCFEPENGRLSDTGVYDLGLGFTLLSFDAMGDFCFGKSFGSLDDPKKAQIQAISSDGIRGLNAVAHMPWIARLHLDKLSTRLFKAMEEYKAYSSALARDCIARAMNVKGREAHCVFDILLQKKDQTDELFSVPELESESSLLVTAGTDTTASALSSTVFHLLNNPDTLKTLTAEIRSTFSHCEKIRMGPRLQECNYLSACIDESLRLTPPVGGCLPRQVPPGGVTIEGHHIPAGTDVGVPHHVVMRNMEYFEEPWSFNPERWIPSKSSEETIRRMRLAFCPFSLGPTGCIGKAWSLIELKLTIAQLVFRYEMEMVVPKGEEGLSAVERVRRRELQSVDRFVVSATKGLMVRIRPRSC